MSSNARPADDGGTFLEAFAAEVTGAAYPIALRHAIGGSWLDLELGLWKALADTVEHWARPAPRPGSPDEFDVWRERFLVELTGEAFHIARRYGVRGSLHGMGWDLYRAFRSVIETNCERWYDATPGKSDRVSDRKVPRRGREITRVRAETFGGRGQVSFLRHRVLGRDDLLAAVAKVFAQRGYHGTDMGLVAEAIQSGKGTIYRYFRSKEELFLAALDLGLRRLREAVDAVAIEAMGPGERVARAITTCLAFFDANPEFAELLILECAEFPARMRCTWLAHLDAALGPWRELYCGPTAQDRVRPVPAERSLDVVAALVCGAVFGPRLTARGGCPESRVQDVLDVVFNGILSDAAQATAGCQVPPTSAASEGPPQE
jgi:AcrR family transcriptional regulator